MEIDIPSNSRVFITGKTGSGKTHFAIHALAPDKVDRLVVFDIKDNLSGDMDLVSASKKDNWRRFLRGYPMRLQVNAPVREQDEFQYYQDWLWRVFYVGDCVVFIDELLGVLKHATDLPRPLKMIYTRGRQPILDRKGRVVGGNIGVFAATQRPSHIPVFCMTESEEFFVFQLQNPDDRKKIADYTSPEIRNPIPDEHGFYYYQTRASQPVYVKEL